MKKKLKKFEEFTNTLFPHEISYLQSIQQFQNGENLKILNKLAQINLAKVENPNFDFSIDKRRYSNLKKWIEEKLAAIDVDIFLKWMLELDEKILTDKISQEDEQFILQKIKQIEPTDFYFARFYETIEHYRDYLLIRVRKRFYQPVFQFLNENQKNYSQSIEINKKLNKATKDIIQPTSGSDNETEQWKQFLINTLKNEKLNGDTRYKALIRLSMHYYKSKDFDNLKQLYLTLDNEFTKATFYSKRLLANYYANRSLALVKTGEIKEAEKFAYLSIKVKNNDYLFYINNLIYILHQQKKYNEALNIASTVIPQLKHSNSFYNRIGFTALYLRTLNNTKQSNRAVSYAQSFFDAYKKEIFDYRWHLFFSAYFEALSLQEKYETISSYCKRYKLLALEKKEKQQKTNNILYWYYLLSEYMTANISELKIKKEFQNFIKNKNFSIEQQKQLNFIPQEFKDYFPQLIHLFNQSIPQEEFIF